MATTLLGLVVAASLLAACGTSGGDPASEPTSSQVATPEAATTDAPTTDTRTIDTAAEEPTERVPPFPDNTARQTAIDSGEWDLVFTDIRVAEHEGFDRIVLEFTGTGRPGWTVNYVAEAALDGSGEVVTLGGDAFVDIYASGVTWPAAKYYRGPVRFEPETGNIDGVYVAGTFEGYQQVLAGIGGDPVPFRVFALTEPPRLVVDIVDSAD